jgi:hypothetical protein
MCRDSRDAVDENAGEGQEQYQQKLPDCGETCARRHPFDAQDANRSASRGEEGNCAPNRRGVTIEPALRRRTVACGL